MSVHATGGSWSVQSTNASTTPNVTVTNITTSPHFFGDWVLHEEEACWVCEAACEDGRLCAVCLATIKYMRRLMLQDVAESAESICETDSANS